MLQDDGVAGGDTPKCYFEILVGPIHLTIRLSVETRGQRAWQKDFQSFEMNWVPWSQLNALLAKVGKWQENDQVKTFICLQSPGEFHWCKPGPNQLDGLFTGWSEVEAQTGWVLDGCISRGRRRKAGSRTGVRGPGFLQAVI